MSEHTFKSHSADETIEIGRKIGSGLASKDIVLLIGDLGAGKTTLTKGLVEALGGSQISVKSPTYTLVNELETTPPIFHFDLYRLETLDELVEIDLDSYLEDEAIIIIEWADKFDLDLPSKPMRVELKHLTADAREITIDDPKGKINS